MIPNRGGGGGSGKNGKHDPRTVFARFVGSVHVLTFEDSGQDEGKINLGMFVSERCSDGDMVVGRIVDSNNNKSLR